MNYVRKKARQRVYRRLREELDCARSAQKQLHTPFHTPEFDGAGVMWEQRSEGVAQRISDNGSGSKAVS